MDAGRFALLATFVANRFAMSDDPYAKARVAIDAAHSADPKRNADGSPAELVYADNMERWVLKFAPEAPEILRLAARCQHLERWTTPRDSYPMDKPGYHAWRRGLYVKQADRARQLLLEAGVPEAEADEAATWVSKTGLKTNDGSQTLEDAACLVFLESEIADFAADHAHYPDEKFVDILRKTWRKMTPRAQAAALALDLPEPIAALVKRAVDGG